MGLGRGSNGAGGISSSSTSNLSASAPPFTVDRSNPNHHSNPLVHYPESSYVTEPFSHSWKYTNSISHKPELDILSTRTTSFPLSDDYRLSDAISTSPSPTHWSAFGRDAKTLGNTLAYSGGVKSYYPPSVPPMVDKSSSLVENGSAYTHGVIDQDYRPEWMHRLEFNQFTSGQQSKRVDDGIFSSGREKIGDMSAQIDYTHCAIDRDYMTRQMDSLDINGIQSKRVEHDGSCSSRMENIGDTSSQFDYTQNAYDWEYSPQQMDSSSINGNLYKRAELDGNFHSERAKIGGSDSYTNPVDEGCGIEFGDKFGEIYGRSNWVTDRAIGILTVEYVNDKLCFEQNPSFPVSGSTFPEYHPLSLSHEMHKNFYNYKNSRSSHEKQVRPDDSDFTSSMSVTRSSPTVVILPPPAIPDILGQRDDSRKTTENDNVGVCNVHFDRSNSSNNKDPCPKPSSEIKEGSLDPKFSMQCNDRGFLSSSAVNELSSSLHINDTFEGNIKERFGSQISYSTSLGLAMSDECVKVVNSVEDSLDFTDHHNLAVDSPCWKGAPSSQFSAFDVEAGSSLNFIGKLNENFGFDEAKHKDLCSLDDPNRAFPAKAGQSDDNGENIFVKTNLVLPLESILDVNHPSKEQILSDDAKAENFMVSTLRSSKGVQTGDALEMPRLNFDFPENLNCGSHTKNSDLKHFSCKDEVGTNLNDASDSSGAVAFHVAEKVLASPSSQEDAIEHVELQPNSKIKTTIKTIHYLSEMLLSCLSYDACTLEEEDILALNHTISNLDACMSSKTLWSRNKQEPSNPMGYISEKFGEYHDMGTVDYKHGHAKDGERVEKSPVFSFLRDDTDLTRDDGMAKSIKKVLEENFLYNEDMNSHAILFKRLWLEAEAILCSISYKARFDRLKIEMEQAKPKSSKENKDVAATMQKVHISPAPSTSSKLTLKSQDSMILKPTAQGRNTSVSIAVQDDDKNDPIMSRFNILKSREDNLKSIDMKNEQQSKTLVGNQFEGEALNMLNPTSCIKLCPSMKKTTVCL